MNLSSVSLSASSAMIAETHFLLREYCVDTWYKVDFVCLVLSFDIIWVLLPLPEERTSWLLLLRTDMPSLRVSFQGASKPVQGGRHRLHRYLMNLLGLSREKWSKGQFRFEHWCQWLVRGNKNVALSLWMQKQNPGSSDLWFPFSCCIWGTWYD